MEVSIHLIKNKPIDSNSYVIYKSGISECIIIDPGTEDCADLLDFLAQGKLVPSYIILTHEHFDHIWGVNKLKDMFHCKVICSGICSDKIVNSKMNMSVFYDQKGFSAYPADILAEDIENRLTWNDTVIEFIDTKGHTKGSMCILINDLLFSGDTIIKDHKTVVKFPGGSREQLIQSLNYIFLRFKNKEIKIFPGHGESLLLDNIKTEHII